MRFTRKDPDLGYLGSNLLLPRRRISEHAIKASLTFQLDTEENVEDPVTHEVICTRKKVLELWDETANHLIVPRDFIAPEHLSRFRFGVVDQRPTRFEPVDIGHDIELRPHQVDPFNLMMTRDSGTVNLACGKGKTVLGLRVAAEKRVPTLIVVNTTNLMEQWKEDIEEHLRVPSTGIIQGSTVDWRAHPIVIAMIHTLAASPVCRTPEFRNRWGLALYDEGHHMSAPVFCLGADVCAGARFSLTATPNRTDGMENIYQYHLGRVIYSDLEQELIPNTYFHVLKWRIPMQEKEETEDKNGDTNTPRLRSYLGRREPRNQVILNLIRHDLSQGRTIMVLSHSEPHPHLLCEMLGEGGVVTGEYPPQEQRMEAIRRANPLFATFQLSREGLDKPELDTLYILTPFSNSNDLQQAWGRVQRVLEGKKDPIVRVIEDEDISACYKACRTLRKFLKAMDYPSRRVRTEV